MGAGVQGKKLFKKLRALDVVVWSVPGFYPHTEKQRALGSGRLPQSVRVNGVLLPNGLAFKMDNSFLVFAQLPCQHQTPAGFSHQSSPTIATGQDTSGNTLCGFVFSAWLRLALGFLPSVQSVCGVLQAGACQSLAFRSVREEAA